MFRTTKFTVVTAAGLLLTLVAMQAVAADRSMRCGTHIIYSGGGKTSAGMYEVLKKCGEPEAKHGNDWIYTQRSMVRTLTFNYQGRLNVIESRRQ